MWGLALDCDRKLLLPTVIISDLLVFVVKSNMIVSKINPSFLLYNYIQKFFETNSNLINKQLVTSVIYV